MFSCCWDLVIPEITDSAFYDWLTPDTYPRGKINKPRIESNSFFTALGAALKGEQALTSDRGKPQDNKKYHCPRQSLTIHCWVKSNVFVRRRRFCCVCRLCVVTRRTCCEINKWSHNGTRVYGLAGSQTAALTGADVIAAASLIIKRPILHISN